MNKLSIKLISGFRFLIVIMLATNLFLPKAFSSFVLGKQYLLKPKRQNTSLVWYAVNFDRSITGGLKINLKVFSEKGKSIDYLDDYKDFVSADIAQRCISKFSLSNYRIEFNENRRSELGFEIKSISDIMYIPIKINYADGFEDYLVRIRIKSGKFAISSRPLQHGLLTIPDPNAVENLRAEQEKERQELKRKEDLKKAKQAEEIRLAEEKLKAEQEALVKSAPSIIINDELFSSSEDSKIDNLIKSSETEFKAKEEEALQMVKPSDEALYQKPLETPTEVIPSAIETTDASTTDPKMNPSLVQPGLIPTSDSDLGLPLENRSPVSTEIPLIKETDVNSSAQDSSMTLDKSKKKNQDAFDEEIEIEGFDEALNEIERLEKLESK